MKNFNTHHETQAKIKDYFGFTNRAMAQMMGIVYGSYKNKASGISKSFNQSDIDQLNKSIYKKIQNFK
jgi:hypothetical protein